MVVVILMFNEMSLEQLTEIDFKLLSADLLPDRDMIGAPMGLIV